MLGEHEALHQFHDNPEWSRGELGSDLRTPEAKPGIVTTSERAEELLSPHIVKEHYALSPNTYPVLSSRELEEIAQVFEEVEASLGPETV